MHAQQLSGGAFVKHSIQAFGLAALFLAPLAQAQRALPLGEGPGGSPVAPTGLEGQPLPAGPFTYHTAEQQDIRVTVLARLPWPFGMAFLPNGDLLIAQRTGEMKRIARGTSTPVLVTGGPQAFFQGKTGPAILHGYMHLAVHPKFASNGYIYLSYTKAPSGSTSMVSAVARAKYVEGQLTDVKDVWVGDTFLGPVSIAMTPDAKLYIAVSGLSGALAQDPTKVAGKVLRLNDDGTIPKDNPFAGKKGYLPEIYTLGHRSASDLVSHPVSGEVFMSEMGPNGGDEINRIKAGRNYGWPNVSFGRTYQGPWQNDANVSTHAGFENPVLFWVPSISVTGIAFYQGDALPKWKGDLFAAGVRYAEVPGTGHLDRILINEKFEELRRESLLQDLHQRIRDVKAGPDGLIYVATDEEAGAILRIEPAR
jgi:aldose sugar dehydrogenase